MPTRGEGRQPKTATKSGEVLAQFAGVSRDTIKEWRKKPGFPVGPDGETELWALAIWRLKSDGVIPSAEDQELPRRELAEIRKIEADAVLKEAKAREQLGQLLDKSAVVAALTTLFHAVRARLQAVPGEIAASLPPKIRNELSRDIEYKIELALRELAAWNGPGGLKSPPPVPATNSGKSRATRKKSKRAAKPSRRGKGR